MANQFPEILPEHRRFIERQRIFFVGSAPLGGGHVNVSPKGYDSLRVISPTAVAYLDLTGSGNETSGHVQENGRVTFMFCAFEGPPLILRLYGTARTVLPDAPEWDGLLARFRPMAGTRQIIHATIHKVLTSCGYGVPFFEYRGERDTLRRWAEAKGPEGLAAYRREKNASTIDGLVTPIGKRLLAGPRLDPR